MACRLRPRLPGKEAMSSCHRMLTTSTTSAGNLPGWRPNPAMDKFLTRSAQPVSLVQMMMFNRKITKEKLILGANYVREELPTRIAHRLRSMQLLPYRVVTNQHMLQVHNLYEAAFDKFQRIPEVRSLEDNDKLCEIVRDTLKQHLTVIPSLIMGVIEVQQHMDPRKLDEFVATMLKSRISRRVIAEQHLANTSAFRLSTNGSHPSTNSPNSILRQVYPSQVIRKAADYTLKLMAKTYGHDIKLPKVNITSETNANFPYPVGHLEYVIGELLRNSIQATIENTTSPNEQPPPIEVLICQNPLQAIIRISDRGGGIPPPVLDHLWSFSKGPKQANRAKRLTNLGKVPKLAATMTDMELTGSNTKDSSSSKGRTSLSSLSNRSPDLRLGIGLPMSKIYVDYWAGNLSVQSLEGYGTDAFVEIWKLGNKNEQILTRASMDAV